MTLGQVIDAIYAAAVELGLDSDTAASWAALGVALCWRGPAGEA
jgi:hypothetical protein